MDKWEYQELLNPSLEELNAMGSNGWELVGTDGFKYTFKRKRRK